MTDNDPLTYQKRHYNNPRPRPPARERHRNRQLGCATIGWIVAFLGLIPFFASGVIMLIYLIFPPPPIDILIMGLDSRGAEGVVARSDSIILLGINPARFQISQLSIPRDLFINVPGYAMQRINTINVLGETNASTTGPELLADSIKLNFGIRADRFARINFKGFIELIDAVGGVDIYIERALVDHAFPTGDGGTMSVSFDSGQQVMSGERALLYARTRHADDDYRRAARQQQVLSGLLARLSLPQNWTKAIRTLHESIETNLTLWDIVTIAPSIILNNGRFDQLVIDRNYIKGTAEGYNVPDFEKIRLWTKERFD